MKLSPGRAASTPWAASCHPQSLRRALQTGNQVSRTDAHWEAALLVGASWGPWRGVVPSAGVTVRGGRCPGTRTRTFLLRSPCPSGPCRPRASSEPRGQERETGLPGLAQGTRASAPGKGRARPHSGAVEEEEASAGWLLQARVWRGLTAGPRLLARRPGHRGGPGDRWCPLFPDHALWPVPRGRAQDAGGGDVLSSRPFLPCPSRRPVPGVCPRRFSLTPGPVPAPPE